MPVLFSWQSFQGVKRRNGCLWLKIHLQAEAVEAFGVLHAGSELGQVQKMLLCMFTGCQPALGLTNSDAKATAVSALPLGHAFLNFIQRSRQCYLRYFHFYQQLLINVFVIKTTIKNFHLCFATNDKKIQLFSQLFSTTSRFST